MPRVFTIGHSNHPFEKFLDLLRTHQIDVVADTRSQPYSKFAPQYNHERLKESLLAAGFQYVYLGRELGGRPKGDEFYDSEGHILSDRVAPSGLFQQGLARLVRGIQSHKVAILCAEENPARCHRHLLIAPALTANGMAVDHIRADARLEPDLAASESASLPPIPLFNESV